MAFSRVRPAVRPGIASVLAMMYLVLFSTLAIGFYAATTTSVQIAGNEQRGTQTFLAAESGLGFIRYQLRNVDLPYGASPSLYWTYVSNYMNSHVANTLNVGSAGISVTDQQISIPAGSGFVDLNGGTTGFRAIITKVNDYGVVRVKVTGRFGSTEVRRAIQLDYVPVKNASAIFDYGVASRGRIYTKGSARIRGATDPTKGSVLSTSMTDPVPVEIHGKEVSGDISVSNPAAMIVFDAGTNIGGTTNTVLINQDHLHKGVVPPEFPKVDTAAFAAYATNTYSGGNTLVNVRIPAGTGTASHPLKFNGNTTIQGVLYIEWPNVIDFGGNVTIQGTIVVKNGAPTDTTNNALSFTGSVDATGVETLPASFGDLRTLTGAFLLAPGFLTHFTGSFGTVNGSIVASQVTMSGNAGGTIKGTVINMDPKMLSLDGSSEIVIASTGTSNYPAGLFFDSHYGPAADTYLEVQP